MKAEKKAVSILLAISMFMMACGKLRAWGPHSEISFAAINALPDWEREILSTVIICDQANLWKKVEAERSLEEWFVRTYCWDPDMQKSFKWNKAFMAWRLPEEFPDRRALYYYDRDPETGKYIYGQGHKCPYLPIYIKPVFRKALSELNNGNILEGIKFAGTLAHYLEDVTCPQHAVPIDGEEHDAETIPYNPYNEKIEGYVPRLLGEDGETAAQTLCKATLAGSEEIKPLAGPMTDAMRANDDVKRYKAGSAAPTVGAKLVADMLHTVFTLSRERLKKDYDALPLEWQTRKENGPENRFYKIKRVALKPGRVVLVSLGPDNMGIERLDWTEIAGRPAYSTPGGKGANALTIRFGKGAVMTGILDMIVQEAYVDPKSPPGELTIQFFSKDKREHRVFYGKDIMENGRIKKFIFRGGNTALYWMGEIPDGGKWVELKIPAFVMDLSSIEGLQFTSCDGPIHLGKTTLVKRRAGQ
ncbi:MAG: hypothetical protein PHV34_15335 [Verrucomicrobiae bacterium]|nr:hypothetical protein [Verrucomicrobiae bacterium]